MWTWEQCQWRGTPHSPKLQHYWSLTVRLFSVISMTFIGWVFPFLQRCSRCIRQPQPTGTLIRVFLGGGVFVGFFCLFLCCHCCYYNKSFLALFTVFLDTLHRCINAILKMQASRLSPSFLDTVCSSYRFGERLCVWTSISLIFGPFVVVPSLSIVRKALRILPRELSKY